MYNGKFPYSEDILQWIWDKLLFETQVLKTESGLPITIIHQGILNTSDGPDFNNAKIELGGILWHGSIELHLNSSGWKQHGHHNDEAYNQVVLHVVVENNPKPVVTKNGSIPEVLNLLPYLSDELVVFINQINANAQLPCASNLNYISVRALEQQIEKAHREYLEKKGNDFLRFYDPDLLPSEAWKNALILSLFDGFGITHNREPMREMGKWFLRQLGTPFEELLEHAYNYSGLNRPETSLSWNYKGVFPANHPKKRISEAIRFSLLIQETSFDAFIGKGSVDLWTFWVKEAGLSNSVKPKILFGTVYLPSLYVLSSLFQIHSLSEEIRNAWEVLQTPIPSKLIEPLRNIPDLSKKSYQKKLGSVHQIRSYCNDRKCHECFVLKKVISS